VRQIPLEHVCDGFPAVSRVSEALLEGYLAAKTSRTLARLTCTNITVAVCLPSAGTTIDFRGAIAAILVPGYPLRYTTAQTPTKMDVNAEKIDDGINFDRI
jgi:hypothetical protein